MKALLIYDIEDDRLRARVATMCLDYGLQRIQYSAFFGEISRNRQEEIVQRISQQAGHKALSVHLFPLCETDFKQRKSFIIAKPKDT